jgi:anthranilate synthase component 1
LSAYAKLAQNRPGTFLFESAPNGQSWSRYSFIGVASRAALTVSAGEAAWYGDVPAGAPSGGDPLRALRDTLALLASARPEGLPPLTGGMVGFLGYDAVRRVEDIGSSARDDLRLPEMLWLLATDVAVLDHHEGTIWLIANAVNWDGSTERESLAYADAVRRLDAMTAALAAPAPSTVAALAPGEPSYRRMTAPERFAAGVRRLVGEIEAGEAFQVVLSQRFEMDTDAAPLDVYRMLRASNPSPYMYLLHVPDAVGRTAFSIVGSSPEALVTVAGGVATMHPIAGTRRRGATPVEDARLERELLADAKENAEHVMLVDLGRNDLGRVCAPGTVAVLDYRRVERYSHVMHLVSDVAGRLAPGKTALDALIATFPAGTLSGAPKVRAMQLIEELEPTRRGVYGGVVGYFDFAGDADTAIAIRTAVIKDGTAYVQAGAGVVADSAPDREDAESRNKAMAVLRAVRAAGSLAPLRR